MEVMEAIYSRRAVRTYSDRVVDKPTVEALLKAAIHAPSSMNQQPWAFVVIQNATRLTEYSDRIKAYVLKRLKVDSPLLKYREWLADPGYNVFHGAGTLVVIYARPGTLHGAEDCCLAAENFMFAARSMGLGTCPIGFARPWFNQAKIKRVLGVPIEYTAVFPVVVGYPSGETPEVERRGPEILVWE